MKVVYVAKHFSGGADDEGAIAHAFTVLGHEVTLVHEEEVDSPGKVPDGDLALFHHWMHPEYLENFPGVNAFWNFDLVEFPSDLTLHDRWEYRRERVRRAMEVSDVGFMTDGDWVSKDVTGKLHFLPQGADERVVGRGNFSQDQNFELLFTGMTSGAGAGRESWMREVSQWYGPRLVHARKGVYREQLRDWTAHAKIVLCPDAPVTDRYWSNRVWNAAGFGAFVLHPYCEGLNEYYTPDAIPAYVSREGLRQLIEYYLDPAQAEYRRNTSERALLETREKNLYRHRVQELLGKVAGRIK